MEWDEFNRIFHSKCPQRQAFVKRFMQVLDAWQALHKATDMGTKVMMMSLFLNRSKEFINNWSPTLKDEYLP